MVIRLTIAAMAAAMLAGCGDGGSSPAPARTAPLEAAASATASPAPAARSKAPVLVTLIQRRPGALIDKITVRTDGTGVFDRPSGGVGRVLRDVEIDRGTVERLREALKDVPSPVGRARGELAANPATYIVRFGGRTVLARQGREPAAVRRPIRVLASMLVGDHITRVLDERLGGVAGSTHVAGVGKEKKAAREVVFFQRQGAAGATLDTISVRTDATATHEKRYGGAGGRFRERVLRKSLLPRLRRALTKLPDGDTLTSGTPTPNGANYLLRYEGRTWTGRAGAIAPSARLAVKLLDGIIDGEGVVKTTRTRQTHSQ